MTSTIRTVIIEDQLDSQELLREDLASCCPQVEVLGTATGVVSGALLIRKAEPDLVLLDIDLEDGSGFDLLEILPEVNFKVIFTTASDQHAIRAFRFSAIDYLLKPIDPDELQAAIKRAALKDSREKVEVLLDRWASPSRPHKLALHNSDKILVVDIDEIIRCESESNYTTFYFVDRSRFLVSKTLKSYDKILSECGFFRVHQSHLVNLTHIRSFEKNLGGYLLMDDESQVPVAVRKRALLMEALESMGGGF